MSRPLPQGVAPGKYNHAEWAKLFEPKVCTGGELRPRLFFAQPHLKVRPWNTTDKLADRCMRGYIGKACAGLNHKYRASGAEIRQAFKDCRFEGRTLSASEWAFPGMREDRVVKFVGACGLSIHELAEGFRVLFGDGALGYANYFNQLADGWTERLHEVRSYDPPMDDEIGLFLDGPEYLDGTAPEQLFEVREGDKRWTALPDENLVIISLGCIHYHLNPIELRSAHQARRLASCITAGLRMKSKIGSFEGGEAGNAS